MNIKEYIRPSSLDEAYEKLTSKERAVILGGGGYLKLGNKEIERAIDISNLGLEFIDEKEDSIEIGAMTTLREIEINKITNENFNGILSEAVKPILGVQMRNIFTIGGSVYGRYGFSDIITALLALDTYVELYKEGRMSLEKFLNREHKEKDILTKIVILKDNRKASFKSLRNTSTDFAILNAAVSRVENNFKVAVGARPGIAKLSKEAAEYLSAVELNEENAVKAGEIAADNLEFRSNIRGSAEYKKEICKALVKRGILEVI
ncbi:FAD binding domain-containing protein [Clostridium sp.]|uniref:FAD binding domain-containing protein n=1 Tax=Clostridium sp. TaxID=1506 RepID=UPI0039F554A2